MRRIVGCLDTRKNRPRLVASETEGELENKVTWPTRDETTRNSLVVCATAVIILGWIMMTDGILRTVQGVIYG